MKLINEININKFKFNSMKKGKKEERKKIFFFGCELPLVPIHQYFFPLRKNLLKRKERKKGKNYFIAVKGR